MRDMFGFIGGPLMGFKLAAKTRDQCIKSQRLILKNLGSKQWLILKKFLIQEEGTTRIPDNNFMNKTQNYSLENNRAAHYNEKGISIQVVPSKINVKNGKQNLVNYEVNRKKLNIKRAQYYFKLQNFRTITVKPYLIAFKTKMRKKKADLISSVKITISDNEKAIH